MADKKKKARRTSLAPEEIILRSIRAKRRFKAIVRLVIENLPWLQDIGGDELGDDVQKNVALLTRRKEEKSLLTLEEKTILNKRAEYRTEEEKTFLNKIIGGLKCFRRYPAHVKKQLAGVTYFVYFGPGRVLIKQDHEPYALYFILTGEVTVTQTYYDHLLNEYVTQVLGTIGPGNMFGEVSLLHDIRRTATITTNLPSEFLILKKTEFDLVLKATVQEQWDLVKSAMYQFEYFKNWDEVAVRECCILSKMQNFPPDVTILGDGYGLNNYVYFILKGTCKVVEDLMVYVFEKNGKKEYKRYKSLVIEKRKPKVSMAIKEVKIKSIEKLPKINEPSSGKKPQDAEQAEVKVEETDENTIIPKVLEAQTDDSPKPLKRSFSSAILAESKAKRLSGRARRSVLDKLHKGEYFKNMYEGSPDAVESVMLGTFGHKRPVRRSVINVPQNVEHHFIQVCFLHQTACFASIIEPLKKRRIISVTPVECLLIPTYWLRTKNKTLWSRIYQYLSGTIPSKEKIFEEFLAMQKWNDYKKTVTSEITSKRKGCLNNSIHNVPYSIRLANDLNFK